MGDGQFQREEGCLCVYGTAENPIYGGYAQCPIHAPWRSIHEGVSKMGTGPGAKIKNNKEHFKINNIDLITQSIIEQFVERAKKGISKYGTTVSERNDLPLIAWIQHCIEEHMDSIVYLQKIKNLLLNNNEGIFVGDGNKGEMGKLYKYVSESEFKELK